jgi:lysophospholipid acyltransferase
MLSALGFLGIYMGIAPKISFQTPVTDWFLQQNLLSRLVRVIALGSLWSEFFFCPHRILVVQLAGFVERSRYYGVWILTEGASILTGLGFTGYSPSGVATWNGAANVDVWKIEVPENSKMLIDSWNIKTNVWLRECVYKRVTPKGQKAGFQSSMLTYITSAIWVRPYLCIRFLREMLIAPLLFLARRLGGILSHFPARRIPHYRGSSCPFNDPPSRPPHRFWSYQQQAR